MARIAHLSDVHTLDPRTAKGAPLGARYRMATRFVSLGRPLDPRARADKLLRSLRAARASGADHVVISGDLTEMGAPAEFEHFASVLDEAGLPDDSVTLVPGNHDAYTTPIGWRKALEGPLRRWAAASATEPGKVVDRGPVALLPLDTTFFQNLVRSGGRFSAAAAQAVEARLGDPALRGRCVLLVTHHAPSEEHRNPLSHWVVGLTGRGQLLDILGRHPHVQLLHGHLHRAMDRAVPGAPSRTRMYGAPAVVDDRPDAPRVRLYDVRDGQLESCGLAA